MVLPSSPNRLKGFRSPSTAPSTSTTPDRSRRMIPVKDIMKSVRNLNNAPPTMDTSRFRLSPIRRSLDTNDGSSLPNSARSLLPSLLTNPPVTSTTRRSHRRRTAALFDDHSDSSHTSAEEDGSSHDENSYDEISEDDDDDDGSSTHSTDTDDDDLDDYMDESTTMNIRLNAASVESKLALLRERFPTLSRGLLLQALHDNNAQFTKAMLQLDASAVPAPAPPRKTTSRKRRKRAHTPSSDDDDDGQDRRQRRKTTTTAAAASWAGRRQMMEAAQTVAFFNTAKPQEIMDVVGCDLTQATKLISLRPFDHLEDLKAKLKEQPGLSVTYVDTYMDIMQGYLVVDQIIQSIEHRGTQLQTILNIWETIGGSPGAVDEEAGTHLTEMDLNKDHHLALDTSCAIYKDAMDGFLTQQPGILDPEFTLKPYQLIGVNWMLLLYRKGISGILADEMGLGKTAQVISFLGRLQELGVSRGPHMIVVPASTLDNWLREFERFCPALEVRCYYGSQVARLALQKELLGERNDIHAVVTTYSMVCGNSDDRRFLRKLRCDSMILDEGHMIKNYASARYDHLMRLNVPFRLLLTGTPLQNNLQELVSLLIFIMPKLFTGSEEDVHKIFKLKNSSAVTAANAASSPHNSTKAAQMLSQQRIDRAKKMMAPFVLRRRKAHVLVHLPKKIHHLEYCTMTPHQEYIYSTLISTYRGIDMDTKKDPGLKNLGNIVMQLRKAADHPLLFRHHYTDATLKLMAQEIMQEECYMDADQHFIYEDMQVMSDFELDRLCNEYKSSIGHHRLVKQEWMDAGKIHFLQQLLPALKRQGRKVLLFSQFVLVLDILERVMDTLGLRFTRLDGSTKVTDRQAIIDRFNHDPSLTVFLLGTRAGGFGINLASANVVVMYDLDFNPHNDKQAEDRAHRVGQTQDVTVYKLISNHTIEQQILGMADIRLRLDSSVSGESHPYEIKSLLKSALV